MLERIGDVDPLSQLNPHAHLVNFDPNNRCVLVCDKGADSVVTLEADPADGSLTPVGAVANVLKPACIKFLAV